MHILYVEDNQTNVLLVRRIAKMGNHTITNLIDGADALEQIDELKPDLILMDVQLSGDLSGLDVTEELRKRGYKTPIIAVTAYAMVGDKERCLEAGCDVYMPKPLPIPELIQMFGEYEKGEGIRRFANDRNTVIESETNSNVDDEVPTIITEKSTEDSSPEQTPPAPSAEVESSDETESDTAEAEKQPTATTETELESTEESTGQQASTDDDNTAGDSLKPEEPVNGIKS